MRQFTIRASIQESVMLSCTIRSRNGESVRDSCTTKARNREIIRDPKQPFFVFVGSS